jgi:hypothetical protein
MNTRLTVLVVLAAAGAARAQDAFEQPPELRASEILKPEFLAGPKHRVKEPVPTMSGANRFTIESDYGVFQADGNAMLETRVAEVAAIAKLREVSKSDEYAKALANAAKAPIDFAERLVTEPGKTVSEVPRGAAKLLKRIGAGAKDLVDGKSGSAGDTATSAIGMQTVKRELAVTLGVDPYSTNPVLQKELDSVAWASFAGGATLKVLLLPVGGGVVVAAKVASTGADLQHILKESSPTDLKLLNARLLEEMGVTAEAAQTFLGNAALSPSRQTAIVAALARMKGVRGRDAYVRAATANAQHEQDAVFWHLTADMIATAHERGPALDRIVLLDGGFPAAIARDGAVVVALHWDYACWTSLAKTFAEELRRLGEGAKPAFRLTISGVASPTLRKELEARGFQVADRAVPGPLR